MTVAAKEIRLAVILQQTWNRSALSLSEGRRLEASELAEKEAARRAQAEASWSQSQTLLARAEEATARAQERVTELEEQIAKMRAAEIKRADSEEWLRAEAGR